MTAAWDGTPLYTVEEVAEILRQDSTNHVKRSVARWPHVKVGRTRVFTHEQVEQIIREHVVAGGSAPRLEHQPVAPAVEGRVTRGGRT